MKLNQFFYITALVFLFALPFLISCGEDERRMNFPNLDLPDSVTVTVEAPVGAAFDLAVSGDFREEVDFGGQLEIVHNTEQKFSFTENFSQTFSLIDSSEAFPLVDPDERYFSVKLKCTALESESDEDTDSFRLIIKFNGDGNFDRGNRDKTFFLSLDEIIGFQITFSRYDGRVVTVTYSSDSNYSGE